MGGVSILWIDEPFAPLAGQAAPEIKMICSSGNVARIADAKLSDKSRPISGRTQQRWISLRPLRRSERRNEITDFMPALILTREDGSAADTTDRGGDKVIF